MKESIIYRTSSLYRDDFKIKAYTFGQGEKSLCIVGSLRGHEYQQMFISSRIVRMLKQYEQEGRLIQGKEVMVIPCLNPGSTNIGKRFWTIDNTDINRMFPGYNLGETTQRIAAGIFDVVNKYSNGIQFSSFYMPGSFVPHVRITHTGFENMDKAADFGMKYVVIRRPHPHDTTTLNYNWQIWETDAYSLYSTTTKTIDEESGQEVIKAVERFMIKNGIITGELTPDVNPVVIYDTDVTALRNSEAGLYRPLVKPGDRVLAGTVCAEIYDTCTAELLEQLISPVDGVVFFQQDEPLVFACTAAVKILPDSMN